MITSVTTSSSSQDRAKRCLALTTLCLAVKRALVITWSVSKAHDHIIVIARQNKAQKRCLTLRLAVAANGQRQMTAAMSPPRCLGFRVSGVGFRCCRGGHAATAPASPCACGSRWFITGEQRVMGYHSPRDCLRGGDMTGESPLPLAFVVVVFPGEVLGLYQNPMITSSSSHDGSKRCLRPCM